MLTTLRHTLFISFILLYTHAFPQATSLNSFQFETYTTNNGLTDNSISKTIIDKKGFLWIATRNGLSRYDGYSFKNYTYLPGDSTSLRSIWTTDLTIDADGTLWISTEGGLCYYDAQYDHFRYLNTAADIHILYNGPLCRSKDSTTLWIAAEDGLTQVNTRAKTFKHTALKRIPDPQCIAADDQGRIMIGTRCNGIFLYHITTDHYQKLAVPAVPSDCQVMALYKDADGTLYAGTNAGLLYFIDTTAYLCTTALPGIQHLDFDDIMCITAFPSLTGQHTLLCGTYDNKMLVFDKRSKKFIYHWQNKNARLSNMPHGIFSCLSVHRNILWIGTDKGLYKLNMDVQDLVAENIPQLLFSDNLVLVKQILGDKVKKELLWLSLDKPVGGIALYHVKDKKVISWLSIPTRQTNTDDCIAYNDLQADEQGTVWAITNKDITRFDAVTHQSTRYKAPRTCLSLTIGPAGLLWIGTDKGIMHFNTHTGRFSLYDYSFNGTAIENNSLWWSFPVAGLQYDGQHTLWLTCIKYGLFSFDTLTKKITPHRQPFTGCYDTRNRCASVAIDSLGNIWSATMAGISVYSPSRNIFFNYNRNHGLQSTYVYSVRIDGHYLWGRGNTGIFSFDLSQMKFNNFVLPAEQNNSFFNQRISAVPGHMLVGYEGGFNIFSAPDHRHLSEVPPNAYISQCTIMNKPYHYNRDSLLFDPPSFGHEFNTFRFDYSAINYNNRNSNTFLCKLEGFDKEWQKTSSPSFATYTNLPPGHYIFKVKTRNNKGLESRITTLFPFTIRYAFWQTLWFYGLCALVFSSVLYAFYRVRINRLASMYKLRSNISKDLHDDIGSALSSISMMSAVAQKKIESNPEDARYVTEKIESVSRSMVGTISDMVWSINPDIDTLEQIIVRLREYMSNMFDETQTRYELECAAQLLDKKISMEMRRNIYLISKEIINNTVKYAQASCFSLHFSIDKNILVLEARDNGQGFDLAAVKKGNGLHNITRRATQQKGTATVTSDGNGTYWLIKMDTNR
jgi:ligand-binding sensor domain-containing protein/two-component sensor histidine kinase